MTSIPQLMWRYQCRMLCLPSHVYFKLNNKLPLQKTRAVLSSYGEFKVKPMGQVNLNCQANGLTTTLKIYVAPVQSPPILGLHACQKLKLEKKVDSVVICILLISIYLQREDFERLPCFQGTGFYGREISQ